MFDRAHIIGFFATLFVVGGTLLILDGYFYYPVFETIEGGFRGFFRLSNRIEIPVLFVALLATVVAGVIAVLFMREMSVRQQLLWREQQYQLSIAVTQDGMWLWDIVKDEEIFSARWLEILGYSQADIRGVRSATLIHPEDQERAAQALKAHIVSKTPYDLEMRMLHKEGYYVWVRSKGQAVWDSEGNPIRMAASIIEITDRMRAEDELRRSQGQFKAIADNSPSLIYLMDMDSKLLMVNKAYQKFYGVDSERDLEDGIVKWFGEKNAAVLFEADRKILATGKPVKVQIDFTAPDGETKPILSNRFPIFDDQYRIIGIGGIDNDISEQKRVERNLLAAMHAAEGANRAKSEFMANMSHELRTPLNAIIGFSEIMANEFLGPVGSPKYLEYAGDINGSGTHLLEIINNMLDLSKIEAGVFELQEHRIDVRKAVETTLTLVKGQADKRGITVEADVPNDLPDLYADERNLKQILLNLLNNAVKFTSEGGTISLAVAAAPKRGYTFRVSDTGIGIAPEDIPMVLTPFGQVESALSRTQLGTGLGLPLTKSMVELHGGSFEIQSAVGEGTTVTIRFPSARVLPQRLNRHETVDDEPDRPVVAEPQMVKQTAEEPLLATADGKRSHRDRRHAGVQR